MGDLDEVKKLVDKEIVKVTVNYLDFNGENKTGDIEVHNLVADEVVKIFDEIKESGFIIEKINTIDNYNYIDEESVKDNNTSGYNFRFIAGTTKLSDHAVGLAIDINSRLNPWVHPVALKFKYDTSIEGTIIAGDDVCKIFEDWGNPDYQHFFKDGDLNKSIKNKLYKESGIENPDKKSRISKFKEFINKK